MPGDSPPIALKQQDLTLTISISCVLLLIYVAFAVMVYRPRGRRRISGYHIVPSTSNDAYTTLEPQITGHN